MPKVERGRTTPIAAFLAVLALLSLTPATDGGASW